MSTKTREVMGLVVRTDNTMELTYVPSDLAGITNAIGCRYIEGIQFPDWEAGPNGVHAYVDDEGRINGAEANHLGTRLMLDLGWHDGMTMAGDLILLGYANLGDEDGWAHEGDLPPLFIEFLMNWCDSRGIKREFNND